ncbi:uncharacterized protein C8Q71DRAFT_119868 [Rhodofomes roseus]|uniref:Uncharacterized protein n=1 Tax=Rhodofomes roseus TaxID=34475 RepID=A0ABQ8KD18_9APHY|nr:uncharacterized protein C8Q71DRAFT_119868 [Rhodofomes roseus]KAH9835437.1 hypothetical protein C8Q71DRAFT_119868 [Rhodofomes roseus]
MPSCSSCGRAFAKEPALRQHCKDKGHTFYVAQVVAAPVVTPVVTPVVAPVVAPVRKCNVCNLIFASEARLDAHYQASPKHPSCSRCGESFKDLTQLSKHIAAAHILKKAAAPASAVPSSPAAPQPIQTTPAQPAASTSASGTSTSKGKAVSWGVCGSCHGSILDLQTHYDYSTQHPKCEECNMGFLDASALQIHTTSAHPPIQCTSCGEGFADALSLQNHMASAHPSPQCKTCGRLFTGTEDLKQHYRDSPNHPSCASCSIGFPDAATFQRHMVDVHPTPVQIPSPVSSEESFVEVRRETPPTPEDYLETRSLPTTPLVCPTPSSATSARSALSLKTQSDASSVSYSSRRASEPSLPSAFLSGDGASAPWADYPLDTPQSPAHEHFDYASEAGVTHEPPPSATTMQSAVLELTDASSVAEPYTPRSSSLGTITPMETPQIRTIHVPLGRPHVERPESALSYVSEHASVKQTPFQQASSAAVARDEIDEVASAGSRAMHRVVNAVQSRPPSVASSVARRHEHSRSRSASSKARSDEPSELSANSLGTTVTPTKVVSPARPSVPSSAVSWHCRSCMKDPCEEPTATVCGHIFCHQCIIKELATSMACPVCKKMFLLRLHVESV